MMNGETIPNTKDVECTDECAIGVLRAFISSELYKGNLGGTNGADKKCQDLAEAAMLDRHENFIAWLSTDGYSAHKTLNTCELPYYKTDNALIAKNAESLLNMNSSEILKTTEHGAEIDYSYVWSCINSMGNEDCSNDGRCVDWSSESNSKFAKVGLAGIFLDACILNPNILKWTECNNISCDSIARLYCFEKCPG